MEKILWKGMERPKKLLVDSSTLTPTYGKFTAEPFERGYGQTIGNSLRRVMLASVPGAAIIAVKIEGATHEFTTIPNVKEDVTDIILNLKEIIVKMHEPGPVTLHLDGQGEKVLCARDIKPNAAVEILNPDFHIATLGKKAKLSMELIVDVGRGYVPAESNKKEGQSIGIVPIDAIFAPVKKVNFDVQNTRIGQMTDYDRLIFEVWTNGSVKPEDAVAYAAKIMKDHMTVFINFDEEEEVVEEEKEEDKKLKEMLDQSVDELELSVRASNCLRSSEIRTIRDLVQKGEIDMLRFRNFGRKSLNEIKEILTGMGLSFGMKIEDNKK